MDPERHHLYPFHLHPPPYPPPPYQYHPSPTVSYPPPSSNVTPIPHQTHPNEDFFRNEVIFLHSLWHQGPPNSNSNSNSNSNPISTFHHHLKPTHSTPFKKKSNPPISDKQWLVSPIRSTPPISNSGWPEFPSTPPSTQALTIEDMAKVSAIRVQKWGIHCFKRFFAGKRGTESESESESDDDDLDQDQDRVFSDGFLEVFDGNEELKGYYLNNWGNGDFMCLVCGGSDQKVCRKFKNCVALIQHTVAISKAKKRAAHRAYGLVVCKVLGWDIQQLHLVSRNLSLQQGNHLSSAEACKDDPVDVETYIASFAGENVQLDPSTATSNVGNDISAEEKKTAGLPLVLDNPGEGNNHIRSAEICKDESLGIETHTVPFVDENIQSVPSTATSDVGIDNADEEKEIAGLPSVLDSPGEGNEINSGACKPVDVDANFVSLVDQIEHSGPSKVTSVTGKNNSPKKKETSDLPLFMITPDVQQINDTSNAGTDTNHSDTVTVLNEHGLSSPNAGDDNEPEMNGTSSVDGQATQN